MMTEFTPYVSLLGGALIGLASVLLMASLGRIMGGTGIVSGLLPPDDLPAGAWRGILIAGMASGPLVVQAATGTMPTVDLPVSTLALIIGGVISGVGATLGSGCTSGHGVCGLARLSRRSVVATLCFMLSCAATVYVMRHVIGA